MMIGYKILNNRHSNRFPFRQPQATPPQVFDQWPLFLPILLLFASFIGGCAGSTGGGLKVVRVLVLYLQGKRELNRLIHPNFSLSDKIG